MDKHPSTVIPFPVPKKPATSQDKRTERAQRLRAGLALLEARHLGEMRLVVIATIQQAYMVAGETAIKEWVEQALVNVRSMKVE